MTDREALIEEAARAVHAVECGCHYDGEHTNADIERRDRIARAALAVFEQAHEGEVKRAQAEALREAADQLNHQMRRGVIDPVKYLELYAVRVENEGAGA